VSVHISHSFLTMGAYLVHQHVLDGVDLLHVQRCELLLSWRNHVRVGSTSDLAVGEVDTDGADPPVLDTEHVVGEHVDRGEKVG